MTRLVIVADHPMVVHGVRDVLRRISGFEVVGSVDGRRAAVAGFGELRPDVVLVDEMQDHGVALAGIGRVKTTVPEAMCVLLTLDMDQPWLEQAFDAGADVVLSKAIQSVALGTMLREVVRGSVIHRPRRPAVHAGDTQSVLTSREAEVLAMVAQGMTNGRVAGELWLTEQTVKFHLSNVYRKLGVSNRTQASHYAHVNGFVVNSEDAPRRSSAVAAA